MSRKEAPRAGLVKAALATRITNQQGARALHLSVRQFQRLKQRVRAGGVRALLHRARGQPSPRRLAVALRQQVEDLIATAYPGLNDIHLTEKLQEEHHLPISRASVRRLRAAAAAARAGSPPQLSLFARRRPRQHRAPWPALGPNPRGPGERSYAGCRVELRELLDGRLLISYHGQDLVTQPSPGPDFVLTSRRAPSDERRRLSRRPGPDAATQWTQAPRSPGGPLSPSPPKSTNPTTR